MKFSPLIAAAGVVLGLFANNLAFAASHASQATGPGEQALNAYLAEVDTLSAEFEQSLLDVDQLEVQRSSGKLLVKRPNKFRWDYTVPYEQLIVSDGSKVWIYDKDLEQATVKPQAEGVEQSPAMILSSSKPVRDVYFVDELGTKEGVTWVMLTPRQSDSEFKQVRLGFVADDLRIMELHDNFSQVTRLRFFSVRRNPRIDDDWFEFQPPAGADVVGDPTLL